MKEWWLQRTEREQKLLRNGVVIISIILIYLLIISPISTAIDALRETVSDQKDLAQWMQVNVPQLQSLRQSQVSAKSISSSELLGTIDHSLVSSGLKSSLAEMKQMNDNNVQLKFNSVNFDDLVTWLIDIQQSYGIVVSVISLTQNKKVGHVEGELTLNLGT